MTEDDEDDGFWKNRRLSNQGIVMEGVREYCEEMEVRLLKRNGRYVIKARNEGGHNSTEVDLLDLIQWLQKLNEQEKA